MKTTIAIVGEFEPDLPGISTITHAIKHSSDFIGYQAEGEWVPTDQIDGIDMKRTAAVWFAPGRAYSDPNAAMRLISELRDRSVPCLGTCRGFQYMVLEFARNVLGHRDATHDEIEPGGTNPFITLLQRQVRKRNRRIYISPGSRLSPIYPTPAANELFFGAYGVNPRTEPLLAANGFVSMASDCAGNYRVGGIQAHPFFMGSMFLPQLRSANGSPHPLVNGFLKAAVLREISNGIK